ncbi:MAG: hypothetical protein COU22_01730 [Candidatus Komeilibacteria bacterium CG10_big_fil_rev_8_21_14_0_10_41_13]|uniref:Uncharacterized protein n=1 Tax=Candidatus Komeilibacteria bacterium CG10_big_fil_rev_8_21_14_0_10_41_13 TaxID=1974476 RepID=A0A2M6WCL5_9BACT|nr:MAG: hypothetical protein COU22_01730 [Candidatus Komeilibacteria bacterium CG10_big_fil_rev_8_21_14_0_10_41_13]
MYHRFLFLTVILTGMVLTGCSITHTQRTSIEAEKINEVNLLIQAINEGKPYQGTIDQGREISRSLAEQDTSLFGLDVIKYDNWSISGFAYPSQQGVAVNINFFGETKLDSNSYQIICLDQEVYIRTKIDRDPDQKKDEEEMMTTYGPNFFIQAGDIHGLKLAHELINAIIFVEKLKRGMTDAYEVEYSDTSTSIKFMSKGSCSNSKQGYEVLFRCADQLGNDNGIATSWELSELHSALPFMAELAKGSELNQFIKKHYFNNRPFKEVLKIWNQLQAITKTSEEIVIYY